MTIMAKRWPSSAADVTLIMDYAPADPVTAVTTTATLITTGMLPALMLAAAMLTAPVSLFLLWLYRRAVVRSMSGQAGAVPPSGDIAQNASPRAALNVQLIDAQTLGAPTPLYAHARRSLVSATTIYVIAGLTYALVLTSAWFAFTPGG
ncbi:MAG TPA: hypothetical protein VFI62_16180, partial [Burkholderiales bacterium]|nr:hypothetical protein [Burkholderiales bacterium]